MGSNNERLTAKLNMLIQTNFNAENDFIKAAELATAKSLISWFKAKAIERKMFQEELKTEIHALNLPWESIINPLGNLNGAWMGIKATFSQDKDQAMLHETIDVEQTILDRYNEVLKEGYLPEKTIIVLKSHRAKIEHALAVLKTLDDIEYQEES